MRKIIENFKKIIRSFVTIFASREFGFIYCLAGTITQIWHTYFLTVSISSLEGNVKIFQAALLSFFISSSLLYFVAIADNEDSKESKKIRLAVNVFMLIEIFINFYYYARHLIIDSEKVQIFDFIFAVLVSCLIPVTIKLYASLIRAKEWMQEIDGNTINNVNQNYSIQGPQGPKGDRGEIDKEELNDLIKSEISELKSSILSDMDSDISEVFQKNQQLFLTQFENRCKLIGKTALESVTKD